MKARWSLGALLILSGCVAVAARAGTVIQQAESAPGTSQPRQLVTLYVNAGKLRIEGENPASGKYVMIFDQARQVTWMADLGKGTYMEFTAAQVQGMANQTQGMMGQMQEAMKQMESQMANMPPEQRAMMEQMMKQQMGGMGNNAAPETTVREKAKGEKIGQFTCTRYEVLRGGQLSQEVCAAPASQLQLDPAAFATFQALAEFYEPLTSQIPKGSWAAPSGMKQIQGFPVQTVIYSGQKPESEWRLVKIENKSLDAGLFVLPANLKKTEMPAMLPRPGM